MSRSQRRSFTRLGLCVLGMLCLVGSLIEPDAEAKKRRPISSSSFQILQVTPSPSPFEIGNGELTLSTVVKVPQNLSGMDVLEVTALISSPTQRSMRFLSQRLSLGSKASGQKGPHIATALVWDGKDQTQTLVKPGIYLYEVRAKLMVEKGAGVLTRMVSRRSRGKLKVTKYHVPEPPSAVQDLRENSDPRELNPPVRGEEESIPEEAVEPAADEIEMLPDESTGHPVPEPGEDEVGTTEEEALEVPQEG